MVRFISNKRKHEDFKKKCTYSVEVPDYKNDYEKSKILLVSVSKVRSYVLLTSFFLMYARWKCSIYQPATKKNLIPPKLTI